MNKGEAFPGKEDEIPHENTHTFPLKKTVFQKIPLKTLHSVVWCFFPDRVLYCFLEHQKIESRNSPCSAHRTMTKGAEEKRELGGWRRILTQNILIFFFF